MLSAVPAASAATDTYPDLKTLPPRDISFDTANLTGLDGGLTGVHTVLRFTNTVWNDGEGDLVIEGDMNPATRTGPASQTVFNDADEVSHSYPAGSFKWHAGNHNHYHYEDWGKYQLWTAQGYADWVAGGQSGPAEETGFKTTSCVLDEEFIERKPITRPWQTYGFAGCDPTDNPTELYEGMSAGWGDTYDHWRSDQWIVLGPGTGNKLPDGNYVVRSVTDPDNKLYESPNKATASRESAESNAAITTFTVQGGQVRDTHTPSGSVILDDMAASTADTTISVEVIGRDDVSGIKGFRVSNNGTNWSSTYRYAATDSTSSPLQTGSTPVQRNWNLADATTGGNAASGTKTVYVQFLDGADKWSATETETIRLDGPGLATPYSNSVGADSPVSHWRLDETSGTNLIDMVGGRNGTYVNNPGLGATGLLGAEPTHKAVAFDGVSDHARIPDANAFDLTSRVTVEAWIKPDTLPTTGNLASVVAKPEAYALQFSGSQLGFILVQPDSTPSDGQGAYFTVSAPAGTIVPGRTYHVAGTYDGAMQRLYVNGALVASAPRTGAIFTSAHAVQIGAWFGAIQLFDGTIDEVAIYPQALAASRLQAHIDAGNPPQTAPAAPTSPAAQALSSDSIKLTWTDNSLNESDFPIQRSTDPTFDTGVTVLFASQEAEEYTDSGLDPNQTYYYRLRARNPQGYSDFTTPVVNATTQAAVPIVTTSTPAGSVTDRSATVSGTVNPNGSASKYWVEYRVQGAASWDRKPVAGSETSAGSGRVATAASVALTGLSSATIYQYRVLASNSAGTTTGSTATFTTAGLPAPSNLGGGTPGTTSIPLTWTDNAADETGFEIQRATSADFAGATTITRPANETSYTDTGLAPNQAYWYRIRAVKTGVQTAYAGPLARTTAVALPTVATGNTSTPTDRAVTLNGTVNPNGAATVYWFEYRVQGAASWSRSPAAGSETSAGSGRSATAASVALSGLASGTTYEYRLLASNSAGPVTGSTSTFITVALPAPTNLGGGTPTGTSVPLTWTDNSADETGFEIQRATSADFNTGATTITRPANDTSYTDTGVVPNVTYWYRIRAVKTGAQSAYTSPGLQRATPAITPAVATNDSGAPTDRAAVLNGTVNPNGAASVYWFEYRVQGAASWSRTPAAGSETSAGNGRSAVAAIASLTSLASGTTYEFRLNASNSAGTSTGDTKTFLTLPLPVPSALDGTATSPTQIDLTWTDNSADETGFELQRSTSSDFSTDLETVSKAANATSHADTGLKPNSQYWYRIRAVKTGVQTTYSPTLTRTTLVAKPLVNSGVVTDLDSDSATLFGSVDPQGAPTKYWFEYRVAGAATWLRQPPTGSERDAGSGRGGVIATAPISGLASGTSYEYRINASNSAGTSTGAIGTFSTGPLPPPSALDGTIASPTEIDLTWEDNSSDEAGFEIQRTTAADFSSGVTTITKAADAESHADTGLAADETFRYRIRAVRGAAVSDWSDTIVRTTAAEAPAVVTGSASGITTTAADLAGTVDPNGATTRYWFEYGTSISYGAQTADTSAGDGSDAAPAAASLSGLTAGTEYHYRLVAENSGGRVEGADQTFTTTAEQQPPDPGTQTPPDQDQGDQTPPDQGGLQQPSAQGNPQPGPPTTPGQTGGDDTPPTTTATLNLSLPRQSLAAILKKGLKVHVKASEAGKLTLMVRVKKSSLGLRGDGTVTVGTKTFTITKAGRVTTVYVKFKSTYRKTLQRRGRSVSFSVVGRGDTPAGTKFTQVPAKLSILAK